METPTYRYTILQTVRLLTFKDGYADMLLLDELYLGDSRNTW